MSLPDDFDEALSETMDSIMSNLGQEFLVDAADTLASLSQLVTETRGGQIDVGYTLQTIRREIHTLKGQGGSFGFPSLTTISHRLENYMVGLETLSDRHLNDIIKFLDKLQEIAESGVNPEDDEIAAIVRALPAAGAKEETFQEEGNYEILLVAGSRILLRAVESELNKRGYRVVTVASPIDVIETVIRTRPDMIIASAVMDKISGIDLARALKAMAKTKDIPFALLTSFDASHPELRELPEDITLVHHGRDITAELDEAVKHLAS